VYLTIGCLTIVWTAVWYVYLLNHPPETNHVFYWVAGLALTGITLVVIGLAVGQIGRSAKHAESTPPVVPAPAPNGSVANAPAGPNGSVVNAPAVPSVPAPTQDVAPTTIPANGSRVVAQPIPGAVANPPVRQTI